MHNEGYSEKYADGGEVGKKVFNQMQGVGKSKYVVNYHDGKKTHKDGSEFYDIAIFKNKVDLNNFIKKLTSEGYVEKYSEGGKLTTAQKSKIEKVMHEFKEGELHSGSKTGPVVKKRDQAVAIALAEANASKKMAEGGKMTGWKHKK